MRQAEEQEPESFDIEATCAVLVCCNAWSAQLLPELQSIIMPERNQVFMTRPLKTLAWAGMGFSADEENLYGIQRADGRICFGTKSKEGVIVVVDDVGDDVIIVLTLFRLVS